MLDRCFFFFFFNDTATTEIYTLSLHDALPILQTAYLMAEIVAIPLTGWLTRMASTRGAFVRSEEHTSELQSHSDLVCRLLLEKKKIELNQHSVGTNASTVCRGNGTRHRSARYR